MDIVFQVSQARLDEYSLKCLTRDPTPPILPSLISWWIDTRLILILQCVLGNKKKTVTDDYIDTYIWRKAMCAVFVIPIHSTDSVELLYAKNLQVWMPLQVNMYQFHYRPLQKYGNSKLTGHRSWLISSSDFFGFWWIT